MHDNVLEFHYKHVLQRSVAKSQNELKIAADFVSFLYMTLHLTNALLIVAWLAPSVMEAVFLKGSNVSRRKRAQASRVREPSPLTSLRD